MVYRRYRELRFCALLCWVVLCPPPLFVVQTLCVISISLCVDVLYVLQVVKVALFVVDSDFLSVR